LKKAFIILLITFSSTIYSVELNTYFLLDNFHFNSNNELKTTDFNFKYGEIVTQEISDDIFLDAGFTKSLISDYSIFTDFRMVDDIFGFNLGIFTNFLNGSSKMLTPGINYGLDFIIPGFFIVNLDLNNTIPNTSPLETGVSINNYNIRMGFYLGETILSANLVSQNNTKGSILTSTSTLTNRYFLNLDLFNKDTKYRISIDLGWNSLSRNTANLVTGTGTTTLTSEYAVQKQAGSIYFNTNFTILTFDIVTIDLGVLLHLIKFPLKNIGTFDANAFFWGANLGVVVNL
jgi:hypothetical protein